LVQRTLKGAAYLRDVRAIMVDSSDTTRRTVATAERKALHA
jgi:hypothetical protein